MSRDGWLPPGVSHEDVERAAGASDDEEDNDVDPREEGRLEREVGVWPLEYLGASSPLREDVPVKPFPPEPAFGSPEAVELAAARIRFLRPAEDLPAILEAWRVTREQRDELADALQEAWTFTSWVPEPVAARIKAALRKAGRQ